MNHSRTSKIRFTALPMVAAAAISLALAGCSSTPTAAAVKTCTNAQIVAIGPSTIKSAKTTALGSKASFPLNDVLSVRSDVTCTGITTITYKDDNTSKYQVAILATTLKQAVPTIDKVVVAQKLPRGRTIGINEAIWSDSKGNQVLVASLYGKNGVILTVEK